MRGSAAGFGVGVGLERWVAAGRRGGGAAPSLGRRVASLRGALQLSLRPRCDLIHKASASGTKIEKEKCLERIWYIQEHEIAMTGKVSLV